MDKELIPEGYEVWLPDVKFIKMYSNTNEFLARNISSTEYMVYAKMVSIMQDKTNAIIPLNDKSSLSTLAEHFGVNRKKIKEILGILYSIGVYGNYEVVDKPYKQYWILNPNLAFKGGNPSKELKTLFRDTIISKVAGKRSQNRLSIYAHEFRHELLNKRTKHEKYFASILKSQGILFEEQKIIYCNHSFFIVDFYLPEYDIIVEVDGRHHWEDHKVRVKDKGRTEALKYVGIKEVIRIKNQDCNKDFIKSIINNQIKRYDKVCL